MNTSAALALYDEVPEPETPETQTPHQTTRADLPEKMKKLLHRYDFELRAFDARDAMYKPQHQIAAQGKATLAHAAVDALNAARWAAIEIEATSSMPDAQATDEDL